jgi:hypothetical protein
MEIELRRRIRTVPGSDPHFINISLEPNYISPTLPQQLPERFWKAMKDDFNRTFPEESKEEIKRARRDAIYEKEQQEIREKDKEIIEPVLTKKGKKIMQTVFLPLTEIHVEVSQLSPSMTPETSRSHSSPMTPSDSSDSPPPKGKRFGGKGRKTRFLPPKPASSSSDTD